MDTNYNSNASDLLNYDKMILSEADCNIYDFIGLPQCSGIEKGMLSLDVSSSQSKT